MREFMKSANVGISSFLCSCELLTNQGATVIISCVLF